MFGSILSSIGLIIAGGSLLLLAYKIIQFYTFFFKVPAEPLQTYKRKDGTTWAMISGSSGGIGFGLAQHLLSLGFGVIIFAHEGIEDAEARLRKQYPQGAIRSFTFNCMTASTSDIEGLVKSVEDLHVTILINNVAGAPMEPPQFRHFKDYTSQGIDGHLDLNCRFMTHLTRFMIPHFIKNAQPRSLILNFSSGGRLGLPFLAVYSANKAYNSSLSRSLTREFRLFNYPIDCLAIVPGDVVSDGNRFVSDPTAPKADAFARMVLERVDAAVGRGLLEVSPYWRHSLQITALDWLPESMVAPDIFRIMDEKRIWWDKQR